MADTQYKSIGEKFEAITKDKRQRPGMIYLQNPKMDRDGNYTLVEVPEKQFKHPRSPFVKQGYSKYNHVKPAPAPTEAKPVASGKNEAQNIADGKAIAADIKQTSK